MEKQLKNLPAALEQHIFQEAQFTHRERATIHAKTKQKKQARWMPRIVLALSAIIFLLIGATYLQKEQSASYRISDSDLDGLIFNTQRHGEHISYFYFHDNNLVIVPKSLFTEEEMEGKEHFKVPPGQLNYHNVSVKTEGTTYFVYSDKELILTFEKIAPRIVVDPDGNRYSSSRYLSKEYELQFVNQSAVNLSNVELTIGGENYTVPKNNIENNGSLSFKIPRAQDTFHHAITLDVSFDYNDDKGNKQRGKIAQPLSLDNSYSDYYTLVITGDSYDTLTLTLQDTE